MRTVLLLALLAQNSYLPLQVTDGWHEAVVCKVPTKRHAAVHRQFLIATGYPHGRPGWVVDHIIPLCACGPDTVTNLQWQTATQAAIKDRREREQCRALRKAAR